MVQDEIISKLKFKLPFFLRYVDDILTAVPIDKKQQILDAFNSYDGRLQFTNEKEKDNKNLEVLCI